MRASLSQGSVKRLGRKNVNRLSPGLWILEFKKNQIIKKVFDYQYM